MTPGDFRRALELLNLAKDDAAAAAALNSDPRTVRRWKTGERAVPGPAEALLALWLRIVKTHKLTAAQKAGLLGFSVDGES